MAAHTPGPWKISGLDPHVIGPVRILVMDGTDVPQSRAVARVIDRGPEAEANARLIAAAPELLDACKRLLKFNEELCADIHVSEHYPSAELARTAIAKAEGD